jgi:dienelactone hydrolase
MTRRILLFVLLLCATGSALPAAERNTGPWDIKRLADAPKAEWGEKEGLLQPVYFAGEPYHGKPTRVFAWYARPEGKGPFPAMVLLHGGGGKAFPEWAKLWAERGYAALAIDLAGHGPDGKRLPDGGPDQDDKTKFASFTDDQVREMWSYHAVADALLAHSLLASQKEVDKNRIGVTGISWGGYLTCIVAGVDERVKCAVPVYGCGFIHENSCWVDSHFKKMDAELLNRWEQNFDPSWYLSGVSCPILFVNGTNDFAYPLDSYQKSYELVSDRDPKLVTLRVTVNMPHGHQEGWSPKEIGLFVDGVMKKGPGLARVIGGGYDFEAGFSSPVAVKSVEFHYTEDRGPLQKRKWKTLPAKIKDAELGLPKNEKTAYIEFPKGSDIRPSIWFFTLKDARGAIVSSEYSEVNPKPFPLR